LVPDNWVLQFMRHDKAWLRV